MVSRVAYCCEEGLRSNLVSLEEELDQSEDLDRPESHLDTGDRV